MSNLPDCPTRTDPMFTASFKHEGHSFCFMFHAANRFDAKQKIEAIRQTATLDEGQVVGIDIWRTK